MTVLINSQFWLKTDIEQELAFWKRLAVNNNRVVDILVWESVADELVKGHVTGKSSEFEHLVIDTLDKYPVTVSWLQGTQNLMHLRFATQAPEDDADADDGGADGDTPPDADL